MDKPEEYYQAMQRDCVVCGVETDNKIIHKTSKETYPLCLDCRSRGYYNKQIFDVYE